MTSIRRAVAATALLVALSAPGARAGVIDLRGLPGNFNQGTWGHPDTTLYAQSVVADDALFSEFRVRATSNAGTGNIAFELVISGDRADGGGGLGFAPDFNDIRFTSGPLLLPNGAGLTEFTINPNILVTPGERLFVTLNTATTPGPGNATVRATQFNGPVDQYLPGEFVFLNAGPGHANLQVAAINGVAWSHRAGNNEDLAILAVFNAAVPEPGTVLLLGLGLAGFGFARRRSAS